MSTSVLQYNRDGANLQARAVLAMFQYLLCDGIESSYNKKFHCYDADIRVARWENCREQGYVLSLRSGQLTEQLNIAFFEHRNSDEICAVKWNQVTMNSPAMETAKFGDAYQDKFDTSYSVGYGEVTKMARWMVDEFTEFWEMT